MTVRDVTRRRREILLGKWDSTESMAEYARIIGELATHQRRIAERQNDQSAASDLTVNALILAFWKHVEVHHRQSAAKAASTELRNIRDAIPRALCDLNSVGHAGGQVVTEGVICIKDFSRCDRDAEFPPMIGEAVMFSGRSGSSTNIGRYG